MEWPNSLKRRAVQNKLNSLTLSRYVLKGVSCVGINHQQYTTLKRGKINQFERKNKKDKKEGKRGEKKEKRGNIGKMMEKEGKKQEEKEQENRGKEGKKWLRGEKSEKEVKRGKYGKKRWEQLRKKWRNGVDKSAKNLICFGWLSPRDICAVFEMFKG